MYSTDTRIDSQQAAICLQRGHEEAPEQGWQRCKWCGLWYRERRILEESAAIPPYNDWAFSLKLQRGMRELERLSVMTWHDNPSASHLTNELEQTRALRAEMITIREGAVQDVDALIAKAQRRERNFIVALLGTNVAWLIAVLFLFLVGRT